ncbi:hypothetical protein KI688_010538 [Linnemannia hyalina]|uniref:Uncharacterized protein n=1 Tax=Linnemannia hyalina TaxID=64524 RepID=A0A9P7XY45_9FUNG|nr:hypothetical protein KI688_004875 [Linnemannia hyalina]KAG9069634.1 hypothetical protein KI688_010538 [Linnemannia hyalina]
MAPKSKTKKSAPKSKKVKEAKPAHPFSSAAVENAFYFVRTAPRLYSAIDYFKTFDPKTSDKQRLHSHWSNALQILLDSPEQQYFDQGKRLKLCWESPENGLGTFWQEREDAKTASDIEDAARDNIRKHSIRSAEFNVLGAIRNLDDQSRSKRVRRAKKKALGKENTDPEHFAMENGQGSHATSSYTKSREGNDNGTQDSEAHQSSGSPEACDGNQVPDGPESPAADSNVSLASMHGPQETFDTDQVSEGDNTGRDAGDDDDLLSQKSTASECERERSLSRGIYYLTGDGSKDCSKALWTPWLVNGEDLAPTLWKYRERAIDAAQRVVPLTSSVERLAVNHIYLFERNDVDSTLFDAVGLEDWRAVTSVTIEKGVEDTTMLELQKLALELSNLSYREAEELILSWNGDTSIKKVLVGLVEGDFLKKSLDENSLGRRPDFMLRTSLRGIICYLFFMEAKKVRQGAAVVQDDLEKMAGMMKDAIDDLNKQGIDVGNLEVIGLHIVGTEGHLYAMKLEARGIYVLRSIAVIYAPKSHFNFGVLATTINVLVHVQKRLEKTISDILASHAAGEQGQDLTCPGFHTPTRVLKA